MIDKKKAIITAAVPKRVYGGAGRGQWAVYCPCGRRNFFDAFSWAGHGACRCKKCKRLIAQDGAVSDSREELKANGSL